MTLAITPRTAKIILAGLFGIVAVSLALIFIIDRSTGPTDTGAPVIAYEENGTGLQRYDDGTVNIDIETATNNQAPHGESSITVRSENATMNRQITMIGSWRGHQFRHSLYKSELNRSNDRELIMWATTTFDPTDDIIEGYLVPRFNYTMDEGTGFDYIVYVDQQFMDAVEDPEVRWGFALDQNKTFEPEEVIDGVYRETVTMENVERLRGDIFAKPNAFVGEWPDKVNGSFDIENETYFHTY